MKSSLVLLIILGTDEWKIENNYVWTGVSFGKALQFKTFWMRFKGLTSTLSELVLIKLLPRLPKFSMSFYPLINTKGSAERFLCVKDSFALSLRFEELLRGSKKSDDEAKRRKHCFNVYNLAIIINRNGLKYSQRFKYL